MSWIRTTVKTVHLAVLLLFCGLCFYNLSARSQQSPQEKQEDKSRAIAVVHTDDDSEDGFVTVESTNEIDIENPEEFLPTKEWQKVKKGQAIPKGLHVRMDIQTGELEAKILEEDVTTTSTSNAKEKTHLDIDPNTQGSTRVGDKKYTLEELKKAVKSMKTESFKDRDLESLETKKKFRSYEELKKDFEALNMSIKTDAEIITELVEQLHKVSQAKADVSSLLSELEYYLHQIDNAVLFCDLGAMPLLLRCLNDTEENVRSVAALTLGSALQSNPKVQVTAIESGAMNELLRVLAIDSSLTVRKRAMFALSAMIRHFPFAQKRFLELGGLSVLGKLFDTKSAPNLQLRAVTLLTDLVKEKDLHTEHSNLNDSIHRERLRQYQEVNLQEALVETGWCQFISALLSLPEHDSREKVMAAMETVLPACGSSFQEALPVLRSLQSDYQRLLREEEEEGEDGSYFRGLLRTAEGLVGRLTERDEF